MKRMSIIATGVAASLLLTLPAGAHFLRHNDPDDVAGKLDIRTSSITRDRGLLTVKVTTYERFTDTDLRSGGFFVYFDSRGGPGYDFALRMDLYDGVQPHCTLYDRDGFSRQEGDANRQRRSFTCVINRAELEATRHIRWRVRSDGGYGQDRAPAARGWYRH